MTGGSGGPFAVGDRVFVHRFGPGGDVVKIGPTEAIRVFGSDPSDPGETQEITKYDVRLDHGGTRSVLDRAGQLERA